ncbi:MAG: TVP38/TMEM64 family protein, partial [Peptostreptococcaceae bacterium]
MNKINKKSLIVKLGIITLIICIYLYVVPVNRFINQMVFYLSMLDLESLKQYILSFGVWAPIISF